MQASTGCNPSTDTIYRESRHQPSGITVDNCVLQESPDRLEMKTDTAIIYKKLTEKEFPAASVHQYEGGESFAVFFNHVDIRLFCWRSQQLQRK